MNRRNYLKTSLTLGAGFLMPSGILALSGCSGTAAEPDLPGFDGKTMGTGYSVRFGHELRDTSLSAVRAAVRDVLDDVDRHMSTWREDSELARFNTSRDTDWQALSPATAHVIAESVRTSINSDGAFDATVGPLVDLWGFGAGASPHGEVRRGTRPSARDVQQTLASVGSSALEVDRHSSAVRKREPDLQLDLSGIAKGHAVDRLAETLNDFGVDSYLVEVGGELRSRGRKPGGESWRVAIESPAVGRREVFRALDLGDGAIATSGDYRNFFDAGGRRYSHSIDPRTGEPVHHDLASVSVVADTTLEADALSTAMMILGPTEAIAYAERYRVAAQLIVKSGSSLEEHTSPAFDARFG